MKTLQIYEKYMVPVNLQKHMLKVAALAKIITDSWLDKNLDKNSIVDACIFHDIAKPMTFDLKKQVQFGMSQEDIKKLKNLQERLKNNYGDNEHQATVKICEEIGLSKNAIRFVNNLEWSYIPKLIKENEIESFIPIYCDMRISPKGILSLKERLIELKKRTSKKDYEENLENGIKLENILKENTSIDPNSITNSQIDSLLDTLVNKEI